MTGMNLGSVVSAYAKQDKLSAATKGRAEGSDTLKTETSEVEKSEKNTYGRTIGTPKLSETAQKYYDQLKKKFGNYDFILVSCDEMENAKANAAKYANGYKSVVLIDEAKIERMAVDENYRKKYEGILHDSQVQFDKFKESVIKSGANVKGFGMQVNEDGTTSFFAVLRKSSEAQKARIEKHTQEKREEKKAKDKKQQKARLEERLEKNRNSKGKEIEEETVTFSADSMDDLIKKIDDFMFEQRSNQVMTESEKQVGQNIDFKG